MALSTDFKDDILNESVNEKRKYQMTYNNDGTVSFTDVTSYSQTGSEYGAAEVNEERQAINELNSALETKQNVYYTSVAPLNEAPFASNKNMVLISQYLDGENNKSGYFSINDNNRSEWKGLSGLMPQSGNFIGFREVYVKQGTTGTEHIMAKITEMYPICGRQYFNFYNHGAWVGWNVISPTS